MTPATIDAAQAQTQVLYTFMVEANSVKPPTVPTPIRVTSLRMEPEASGGTRPSRVRWMSAHFKVSLVFAMRQHLFQHAQMSLLL